MSLSECVGVCMQGARMKGCISRDHSDWLRQVDLAEPPQFTCFTSTKVQILTP